MPIIEALAIFGPAAGFSIQMDGLTKGKVETMWCSDPFLDLLKSLGYSVVRLPKTNIRPLQVLMKQGKDLDRLGEIDTLFVQGAAAPLPGVTENKQAANISGKRTGGVNLGLGVSILGNIIAAMGGSKLGLDLQYKEAKTVAFELNDVLEDSIEMLKLDQYLADSDINPLSRYAAELLEADDLYVTTATIKSKKFSVEGERSNGLALAVDVPVIQQVVGANVKVSADAQATSKVTYEGNVPLVFGFQAVQLFYERGQYTAIKPLDPGGALRALPKSRADGATPLTVESAFVRLGGE